MKSEDNLATKYAFRNIVCDMCSNVLFLANNYMNRVSITHFAKLSLILINSSHEIFKLSVGKNKKRMGKKTINLINLTETHFTDTHLTDTKLTDNHKADSYKADYYKTDNRKNDKL